MTRRRPERLETGSVPPWDCEAPWQTSLLFLLVGAPGIALAAVVAAAGWFLGRPDLDWPPWGDQHEHDPSRWPVS